MDITRIQRSVFYRYQHVTGSKCVLVSVRFGKAPPNGPTLIRLLAMDRTEPAVQFDLSNHVSEILAGVARANDDPGKGQAEHVAYQIAMAVGRGDV
ncbi:hypothetical protein J2789_003755 [Variovorax paradoxus]|uniref:hypothetical protein n=1 Tax=Variovorax atrisoli TaxID=3394203 RepID=UPI00119B24B3|nr:hypothetical protein [Variovorax paradoxus]MDR6521069.1 hypothetical protein [Variovorax paradoxus]